MLDSAIARLEHSLKWTEHFGGDSPPSGINTKLILPSTAKLPKGTPQVNKFVQGLRVNLKNAINKCVPNKFNYHKNDLATLYKIGCNKDAEVLAADKNLGAHYLPRSWSKFESHRQLSDRLVYSACTLPRRSAICNRLTSFIKNNTAKSFGLSNKEYIGLLTKTKEAITKAIWPLFKVYPKVHKLDEVSFDNLSQLKGRPIIGAHSAPSSYLSIYVDGELAPYAWTGKGVLKDSKTLARELSNLDLPSDVVLATADVISLYPQIPTPWGCRVVKKYLLKQGVPKEKANFIHDTLLLVLTSNVFTYDDEHYIQIRGTAMGTHCAPTYATIVLIVLEQSSKISWDDIYFFRRFIDDLLIFGSSLLVIERFLASYSSVKEEISLTWETGDKIDFLNFSIYKGKDFSTSGKLSYRPYAKKFNKFLYLPFSSSHPPHMKKAFVKGLVSTLVINSSSFPIYLEELSLCYDRLRARGYPLSLLQPIFQSVSYNNRASYLAPPRGNTDQHVQVLNLPYNSIFSRIRVGKIVNDIYDLTLDTYFTVLNRPIVSWSRTHNVSDILNITRSNQLKREGHPNNPSNPIN